MRDHPTPSMLDRFLSGDLTPDELDALLGPEVSEDAYDTAVDNVVQAVRRHGADAPRMLAAIRKAHARIVKKGYAAGWRDLPEIAVFEALLRRAKELRYEARAQMERCAWLAMLCAQWMENLAPQEHADLVTRGLAEYASALRISGKFAKATEYLDEADRTYRAGTRDPVLGTRLKDIRASLYGAQEHYAEAIELADEVASERLELGDRRGAATAIIQKAVYTGYAGGYEEELRLLEKAGAFVARVQDSMLSAVLLSNRLYVLVELGRASEALVLLEANRSTLWSASGQMIRCRLLDIEGRIQAALGRLDLAELLLIESKQEFKVACLAGHEALAGLDLATVILHQSRSRYFEAAELAVEALKTFSKTGVKPRIEEALFVLSDALSQGLVTAPLLQSVADFVRRAEHDRRARYQPKFE